MMLWLRCLLAGHKWTFVHTHNVYSTRVQNQELPIAAYKVYECEACKKTKRSEI